MTRPDATMAEAATFAGLCYDRFRKGWRRLVREAGFPAPFRVRPYLWRREPLQAWQARQEEAIRLQALGCRPPANENRTGLQQPSAPGVARQRSALLRRMGAGQ